MTPLPENLLEYRCVLLSGNEDVLRKRALSDLIQKSTLGEEYDLESFVASETPPARWFGSATTLPFLGEKRVVVIRNILRLDAPKDVLKGFDLSSLPPSAFMIFVADEENGDETKQDRMKRHKSQWESVVKSAFGLVMNFEVDPKQLKDSIKLELLRIEKKMSDPAIETLIEMTNGSYTRCIEELEKLDLFTHEVREIRESDVKQVVIPSREWSVYKLVDAIMAGDTASALRQTKILIGTQSNAADAVFARIFPTIIRQLRLLWQARICIENSLNPSSIPAQHQNLFPKKQSLSSEPDWRARRVMSSARNVSFHQLRGCFKSLLEAESKLKGAEYSFSVNETLEQMILDMIGVIQTKNYRLI